MNPAIRREWKGLSSVMRVYRQSVVGAGKTRSETSYSMNSFERVRAAEMLGYIRSRWAIENCCNRARDTIYRENNNQPRDRTSAANQFTLRRMALNAHNHLLDTGKRRNSLPKRKMHAVLDPAYLEKLLSLA